LPAAQALAFEDSANGLRAARAAGLATVVTPNAFTAHHDFGGALQVLPSLQSLTLAQLQQWHAMPSSTSSPPAKGKPPCP
jgi:beta-phosphoglucomutase-like phosphatase (HAD superfamily)